MWPVVCTCKVFILNYPHRQYTHNNDLCKISTGAEHDSYEMCCFVHHKAMTKDSIRVLEGNRDSYDVQQIKIQKYNFYWVAVASGL